MNDWFASRQQIKRVKRARDLSVVALGSHTGWGRNVRTEIRVKKPPIIPVSGSLRTADAFPVVASLPREATTGNASAVRRLSFRLSQLFFGKHGCVSSSDFASIVFIARLALSSLEFPFALVNSEAEIRHVVSWELIFGPEIFLGFDCCLHRLSRSNFRIIS